MSGARRRGFLLPPRPRLRDWPAAGAAAGLLLFGCELALGSAAGAPPIPGSLRLLMLLFDGLAGGALAGAAALILRAHGVRPCYSALAGAAVGIQAGVASLDALLAAFAGSRAPAGGFAAALLSGAAALAAGVLASRLCERLERAGLPVAPLSLWIASGALLALTGLLPAGRSSGPGAAALAAIALAPLAASAAVRRVRRVGVDARLPLSQIAWRAALLAALACGAPSALPWMRYGGELRPLPEGPPSVVFISADAPSDPALADAVADLIGWNGVRYSALAVDPAAGGLAPLRLADGRSLVAALGAAGFATASLHADAAPGGPSDFARSEGARRALSALASEPNGPRGAGWLQCCARLLARALRLDAPRRTPAELSDRAGRWLLEWRSGRVETPFLLWVDYRGAEDDGSGLVPALAELLRQLDQLGIGPRATLVLALPGGRPDRCRAVVRAPENWPRPEEGRQVVPWMRAEELAEALLAASQGDGSPRTLPGLPPARARLQTAMSGGAEGAAPTAGVGSRTTREDAPAAEARRTR